MRVRTYLEWCNLRSWLRKKGYAFRTIFDMWSFTLVDGDCEVYCGNKMHLMSFEQRISFNLSIMGKFLSKQMLQSYEKRQTSHL